LADLPAPLVGADDHWAGHTAVRIVAAAAARPDRSPVYLIVPPESTDPGAPVLTLFAQAVAGAMETVRAYLAEHQLALTLQQSMLPQRLPRVAGVDLAKRYVPASEVAEIGGDFYELSLLDGCLVVAVGDVGGHSLHAATVMAELRHALRAYIVEGHTPAVVLEHLNVLMRQLTPDEIATVCPLVLDPGSGRVTVANAGHPAPLLVEGESVRALTDHGALLGPRRPEADDIQFDLPAGAPDSDLDAYCDRVLQQVGPAQPCDDIAIVALRRH
jgi:hypothetical protein